MKPRLLGIGIDHYLVNTTFLHSRKIGFKLAETDLAAVLEHIRASVIV